MRPEKVGEEGEGMKTRCGDCIYFEPERNPKTDRPLTSKPGFCEFPVSWPILPKSFEGFDIAGCEARALARANQISPQWPSRWRVERDDCRECRVFVRG